MTMLRLYLNSKDITNANYHNYISQLDIILRTEIILSNINIITLIKNYDFYLYNISYLLYMTL